MPTNRFGASRTPDPPPGSKLDGKVNAYSAGKKRYGGGRSAPSIGPVKDVLGYKGRDLRNAVMRRMKVQDKGKYIDKENLKWR